MRFPCGFSPCQTGLPVAGRGGLKPYRAPSPAAFGKSPVPPALRQQRKGMHGVCVGIVGIGAQCLVTERSRCFGAAEQDQYLRDLAAWLAMRLVEGQRLLHRSQRPLQIAVAHLCVTEMDEMFRARHQACKLRIELGRCCDLSRPAPATGRGLGMARG